jgi:heptosyltransferase II
LIEEAARAFNDPPEAQGAKHKILVRSTNWLGDVVMAFPFLAELRRRQPEAQITLLARPRVASILQNQPGVDRIVLDRNEGLHQGWSGFFNLAGDLSQLNFNKAYILPNSFGSAFQLWLAGIPERIGFHTDGRGVFLTHAIRKGRKLKQVHESRLYLRLLDGDSPLDSSALPSSITLTDKERSDARIRLEQEGLLLGQNQQLVGMIPGAAYGTAKRWPEAYYIQLAEKLIKEFQCRILLFGAPSERDITERVASQAGTNVINLAGRTNLRQLAALLSECRVVVSNDTGAMHVAAAVGTPVVALFGPTNPVTTSPGGRGHRLLRKPVDCSPCLLRHCPMDHRCMKALIPEEVFPEVAGQLNSPGKRP